MSETTGLGRSTGSRLQMRVSALALTLSCLAMAPAFAKGGFITVDVKNASATFPVAINAGGSVTGYYVDASGINHGFDRTADGTIKTFDPKGSIFTSPLAINKVGTVAGYYADSNNSWNAFLRSATGKITHFAQGPYGTQATDINSAGRPPATTSIQAISGTGSSAPPTVK